MQPFDYAAQIEILFDQAIGYIEEVRSLWPGWIPATENHDAVVVRYRKLARVPEAWSRLVKIARAHYHGQDEARAALQKAIPCRAVLKDWASDQRRRALDFV